MQSSIHKGLLLQLSAAHGSPRSIEPLGGKSGANVYRVRFARTSRIIKHTSRAGESDFYLHAAPLLRENGIPLPKVETVLQSDWIVLEDIPDPLPREMWHGDHRVVEILARLHSLNLDMPSTAYSPKWDNELTEKMLACFEPEIVRNLKPILTDLQHESQPLFEKRCWISGDPNPTNWGVRADGSLVLFDWDRFTRATPAIDLAIIVGGLGNRRQFDDVATTYLREREKIGAPYPQAVKSFGRAIAIAKIWVVVEYLSLYTLGQLQPDSTLEMLTNQFGSWLDALNIDAG